MGSSPSKVESKVVDATVNVNNNVVIQEEVDVYSDEIVILLGIICVIKVIELLLAIYNNYTRKMKKRYQGRVPAIA